MWGLMLMLLMLASRKLKHNRSRETCNISKMSTVKRVNNKGKKQRGFRLYEYKPPSHRFVQHNRGSSTTASAAMASRARYGQWGRETQRYSILKDY